MRPRARKVYMYDKSIYVRMGHWCTCIYDESGVETDVFVFHFKAYVYKIYVRMCTPPIFLDGTRVVYDEHRIPSYVHLNVQLGGVP